MWEFFLRAAAKCQTMCVSNSAQGKVKPKKKGLASTPTYLFFYVGDCVDVYLYVCVLRGCLCLQRLFRPALV